MRDIRLMEKKKEKGNSTLIINFVSTVIGRMTSWKDRENCITNQAPLHMMALLKKIDFTAMANYTTSCLKSYHRAITTKTLKILSSIGSVTRVNFILFRLF